jgi:hypothetical protein
LFVTDVSVWTATLTPPHFGLEHGIGWPNVDPTSVDKDMVSALATYLVESPARISPCGCSKAFLLDQQLPDYYGLLQLDIERLMHI